MGRQKQNIKIPKHYIDFIKSYADTNLTMDKVLEKYPNEDIGDLHESMVNIAYLVFDFLIKELKIKAEPNKKILNTYSYWNKDIFEDITPTESEGK